MAHIEPWGGAGGLTALDNMDKLLQYLATNIDDVAQRCINKADPIMESAYTGALSSFYAPAASMVLTSPAKRNSLGNFSVSRPIGHRPKDGTRYAALVAYLQNGTKPHIIFNGWGIPDNPIPHPGMGSKGSFIGPAVAAAEGPTTVAVAQAFSDEIDKFFG